MRRTVCTLLTLIVTVLSLCAVLTLSASAETPKYTVDFAYGDKIAEVLGGTKNYDMDAVFSKLEIGEKIVDVKVYDRNGKTFDGNAVKNADGDLLFDIPKSGDGWTLNIFRSFTDEFTLKAFSGKNVYEILVTDPKSDDHYDITYETNGGSAVANASSALLVFPEEDPTKDGCVFDGWYTDSTLKNKAVAGTEITKSTTLYAKWAEINYLTFTAEEANSTVTVNWSVGGEQYKDALGNLYVTSNVQYRQYSDGTWTPWTACPKGYKVTLAKVGDKLQLSADCFLTTTDSHFTMTGKIAASGDVTTLLGGTGDVAIPCENCFECMFSECPITAAPNLPSTTITAKCYSNMFSYCKQLKHAPVLPATELKESCYISMFASCKALEDPPALPATDLAEYCYAAMFQGCSSLKSVDGIVLTDLKKSTAASLFAGADQFVVYLTDAAHANVTLGPDKDIDNAISNIFDNMVMGPGVKDSLDNDNESTRYYKFVLGKKVNYDLNKPAASASVRGIDYDHKYYENNASVTLPTLSTYDYYFRGWSLTKTNQTVLTSFAATADEVTLYAVWADYVKEQPSKTNDYTFKINGDIPGVTYQWYKTELADLSEGLYEDSWGGTVSGNSITADEDEGDYYIDLWAFDGEAYLCFDYTGSEIFEWGKTATVIDSVNGHYVVYSEDGEFEFSADEPFTVTNVKHTAAFKLTGETNAKLSAATENASYFCKATVASASKTLSSSYVTTKEITFAGEKGVTGTAPKTVYQLKGRTVILPANPFTADGGIFTGWSDGENKYLAGSAYTVTGDTAFTAKLEHVCHNLVFDTVLCEDTMNYREWYEDYELSGGNYYLSSDLTLTANITLTGNTAICLNGHVLNLNGYWIDGWTYDLILTDCQVSDAHTHYYKIDEESGLWTLADVSEYDKAVKGGAVTGGTASRNPALSISFLIAEDVNFIGNGSYDNEKGGAVHVVTASIRRCRFFGNVAEKGGALYADNELALYASEFEYNRASSDGGAVYAVGKARIENCTLKNNEADKKGGALLFACENNGNGALTVLGTVITDNKAGVTGGGIAFDKAGCFAAGTKITMADGTEKNIEDIKVGDIVKTFNHETGVLENGKVSFVYESPKSEEYFTLSFVSGKTLNIYDCHDLFDKTANRYVTVSSENCADFIGHEFYNAADGVWETLESATLSAGEADYYSIYVFDTQNCIANGMLSVPDDVDFILNVYEFDSETLKVNEEALAADIAKYGLFTYEECKLCDSREMFDDANLQYKNLYIGKGLITAFELNEFYYSIHGVDEFTKGIEGFAVILGKNAVIKNNKVGESNSNVALDRGAMIYVVDGAVGIEAGVSLSGTVGIFAKNVYTNDASKVVFTSDFAGLTQFKTAAGEPATYTYSFAYIKEQPCKNNDYTVVVDEALTGVTYQWYRYHEYHMADLSPTENDFESGDYDESSLAGDYELNVCFATKYFKDGGYLKYKGNGDFFDFCDEDGYFVHQFSESNIVDDSYFFVLIEGTGYLEVTDFIIVWDIPLAGETNAKLGTTALEDSSYYCKLSKGGAEIAESDLIAPVAVSFAGGTGTTGTAPATVYQLEGRKITLPANPFTKTGYKFNKWGSYTAGTSYTVGSANATLTATWIEKATLTIDMTAQESEKGANLTPFTVKCTETTTGFTVSYRKYSAEAWSTTAPNDIGVYQVRIRRAEDDTYKAVDISTGIYSIYYVIAFSDAGSTSGSAPKAIKSTVGLADFNPETSASVSENTLAKEGFVQDGWLVEKNGKLVKWEQKSIDFGILFYPCWKPVVKTLDKSNDFTVALKGTGISYQWYEYTEVSFDKIDSEKYSFVYGIYDAQSKKIISTEEEGCHLIVIALDSDYTNEGACFTCKLTCEEENDYYDFDQNYLNPDASNFYRVKVVELESTMYVYVISWAPFTATDLTLSVPTALTGETKNRITTISGADLVCKVSYINRVGEMTFVTSAVSNAVTPVKVSFAGGEGATGTAPTALYQLEGRKITLPANTFTKTNCKFDKWETYAAGTTYTVGSSDVTLTAVWTPKTAVSITETAQSVTYNGKAQTFAIKGTHKDIGSFTVKYYVNSVWTTEAPTNAGEYDVKILRAEDATYASYEKTVSAGLVIKKYVVPEKDITLVKDDFTYNGQNQAASLTASYKDVDGKTVGLVLGTCNFSNVNGKKMANFTDAGDYTAVFIFKTPFESDNYALVYEDDGDYYEGYFTMKPMEIVIDWVSDSFTYNGSVQTVTASYKDIDGKVISLTVSLENFKNAGKYTAVASFANGEKNYALSETAAKSYTMAKANSSVATDPTAKVLTYNGSDQVLVNAGSAVGGTVQYKLDGSTYSENIPTAKNAGTYTVYYKIAGDANHSDVEEAYVSVTVEKLAVNEPTVNGTYTYTGNEQTANVSDKGTFMTENGAVNGINADTYTIVYTLDNNHKWADGSDGTVTWTIAKANAVITVDTTPIVKTFGGSIVIPSATTTFGEVVCNKTSADLINAGTYTITYTVEGTDNYNGDVKTVDVTVNKLKVNEPAVSGTYTYTGSELTAAVNGKTEYMTETGDVKATNAGNYTINYTLDANHEWADGSDGVVTWNIAKSNTVITVDTAPIVKTFGDELIIPAATSTFGNVVCDKIPEELINAGTYTVTYTVEGTDNYNGDTKTVEVTVNKLTVSEPTVIGAYKYNGTRQTVVLSGAEDFMTAQGSLTQAESGVYSVVFTLDANHEWADGSDGIITWEIKAITIASDDGGKPEAGEKQSVIVETEEGFPSDITVIVEVTVETSLVEQIKNNQTIIDYYNIQDEDVKLGRDEQIGVVFSVKLIQIVNGEQHEIQPSDIAPGTKIRVKMLIPEDVDVSKVTRILHVHSADDIEEIPFDASMIDENGYYEIEIDRLSEFAFVYERDFTHWIALALLIVLIIFVAVLWFCFKVRSFKKNGKLKVAPVIGFAIHFICTAVLVFFAFCIFCWIAIGANAVALVLFILAYLKTKLKTDSTLKS